MRKIFLSWILLSGLIGLAFAQVPMTGAGLGVPAAAASYTGPGDTVSTNIKAWWGLRAWSNATTGTKVANVCDDTGANCADFVTDSSGNLVFQTLGSNNCATSGTCIINKLYDISGQTNCNTGSSACDLVSTSTSSGPKLVKIGTNNTACAKVTAASTQGMATATAISSNAQPFTNVAVSRADTGIIGVSKLIHSATNNTGFGWDSANIFIFAGGSLPENAASLNGLHALASVFNNASSHIVIDNTDNSANLGSSSGFSGAVDIFAQGSAFTVYMCEGGVYSGGWTSTQWSAMRSNQQTYYATP